MAKHSDKNLGLDIIEYYKKYRQPQNSTVKTKVMDKDGKPCQFQVPPQYEMLSILGKGSYGVVCAAKDKNAKQKNKQFLAIKRIDKPFDHKILTKRMLRQLHLLKILDHQNIIKIQKIFMPKARQNFNHVYAAFELMDSDLHEILRSEQPLSQQHYSFFLYQILRGLKYVHSGGIVHRDLKPRNLLVNQNCDLKICDFGLARSLISKSKSNDLTDYVATRWYRAPQLLLGCHQYTAAVDIWSVGCIFAQMLLRKAFLKGKTTKQQLELIGSVIGTDGVQNIKSIPAGGIKLLKKLSFGKGSGQLDKIFSQVKQNQRKLLKRMLQIDPQKRITAAEALRDPFFIQLHDQKDEPVCQPIPSCDFQFQQHSLNTQQLKDILYEQILTYNYPQFAKQYDQKRKQNKSLIQHILKNSNAKNRDPVADESQEQPDEDQN